MKKFLLFMFVVLSSLQSIAQEQTDEDVMKGLVTYHINSKGFYERKADVILDNVGQERHYYAYDKKNRLLYFATPNSNVVIKVSKEKAKTIKKDKTIPQLKDLLLEQAIAANTKKLDNKFAELNFERQQEVNDSIKRAIEDSIAEVKRQLAIKAKIDSLRKAKEVYRQNHKFRDVPTDGVSLHCILCQNDITEDSIRAIGIANDSIYYLTHEEGDLNLDFVEVHIAELPQNLLENEKFKFHYEVFKDSLTDDSIDYDNLTRSLGYYFYTTYQKELRRLAPFGYFKDWNWGTDYHNVTFNFTYTNTNPRTIKYIVVYFKITNDVGDIRKVGNFQGTGPLKQDETASWDWDSSPYYISGDATSMSITKVVITYMNGKTQVVTGRFLRFNSSDDDEND